MLEPGTIDGLVYASSMIILHAARHRLPVPHFGPLDARARHRRLARGERGPGLVPRPGRRRSRGVARDRAGRIVRDARVDGPGRARRRTGPRTLPGPPRTADGPAGDHPAACSFPSERGRASGSVRRQRRPGARGPREPAGLAASGPAVATGAGRDIDAAAVAAYRGSMEEGKPLSERKLAAAFGKTSRRWARNRIAEAQQGLVTG